MLQIAIYDSCHELRFVWEGVGTAQDEGSLLSSCHVPKGLINPGDQFNYSQITPKQTGVDVEEKKWIIDDL